MSTRLGNSCCWCFSEEKRRRHMIHTAGKDGKPPLIDCLKKIVIMDDHSLVSNWVCESCYLHIRSLSTAEKRFVESKMRLLDAKAPPVGTKRTRPSLESPASQPSQSAKVYRVSHESPTINASSVKQKKLTRKQLFPPIEEDDNDVQVKIEIQYPSKTLKKDIRSEYHSLCKALARGSDKSIASAALRLSSVRHHIINSVCQDIEKECKLLSGKKQREDSPFCRCNLNNFSLSTTWEYIQANSPLLYKFLSQCTKLSQAKETGNLKANEKRQLAAVVVAISILMNGRNPTLNALQSIIGIVLHAGHAQKMVYTRLNHIAISISYPSLLTVLDEFGKKSDELLLKWQQEYTDITRVACEANANRASLLSKLSSVSASDHHQVQPTKVVSPGHISKQAVNSPLLLNEHNYTSLPNLFSSPIKLNSPQKLSQLCISSFDLMTFRIILDNLDFYMRVRDMRQNHQNMSIHWVHVYALLNRVFCDHLDDHSPRAPLASVSNESFLPTSSECTEFRSCMGILVSRVLVKHMKAFEGMSTVVTSHIPHKYSSEMKKKSTQVWLGLLFKNEQTGEDMIDIAKSVHKYVPGTGFSGVPGCVCETHLQKIPLGGDQLTMERLRSAIDCMSDSHNDSQRLEGIIPAIEDWHAKQCLLQVIWHILYSEDSARDESTLYQLRNLINRRNVHKDPKDDVNACEDFLELVTDAHIIHAVSIELGSIDGETLPQTAIDTITELDSAEKKKEYLMKISLSIVDKYILPLSPCSSLTSSHDSSKQDFVFNYARKVLTLGMVHRYFRDAIKEGDGDRVFSCWKILLPLFKQDGRAKYALEAFLLLAQDLALLSPKMAYQLKWGRFVNCKGGPGNNISCDLRLEHMNKFLKQSLHSAAPGFKQEGGNGIKRVANSISMCEKVVDTFDENFGIHKSYGSHSSKSMTNDLKTVLNVLTSNGVFKIENGRKHKCSKCNHSNTLFETLDLIKFNTWISKLKTKYEKIN